MVHRSHTCGSSATGHSSIISIGFESLSLDAINYFIHFDSVFISYKVMLAFNIGKMCFCYNSYL